MAESESSPLEQIAEAVLYAPIGLVYEYKNVVPTLVRRGKSQVQIAKLMGQMAAKEGSRQAQKLGVDGLITEVVETAASTVAKGITEVGVMVGLAPDEAASTPSNTDEVIDVDEAKKAAGEKPAPKKAEAEKPAAKKAAPKKAAAKKTETKKAAPKKAAAKKRAAKKPAAKKGSEAKADAPRLPIARYDDLKAREIIPLLDDLSSAQRATVRAHEANGRNRKTILSKLDRLED